MEMNGTASRRRFRRNGWITIGRAPLLTALLALLAACGDSSPDPPPLPDSEPAPQPFPPWVQRGVVGTYEPIGGSWAINPAAYSYRYHTAFDRLSVYAADRTRCDAVRITQPADYGPPFDRQNNVFAIVEAELYDRTDDDTEHYRHDRRRNLLRPEIVARIKADSARPESSPDVTTDGNLTSPIDGDLWASTAERQPHWIQYDFSREVAWNQLVIYWPMLEHLGPWPRDINEIQGLRSQRIVVQARRDGQWTTVPIEEQRPGARHDGHFLRRLLRLPDEPASRLSHLDAFGRWRFTVKRDLTLHADATETEIEDDWQIAVPEASPDLLHLAARELSEYLEKAMAIGPIAVGTSTHPPVTNAEQMRNTITIGLLDDAPPEFRDALTATERKRLDDYCSGPESYAIFVGPDRIWAMGRDALGARYAACRIEEHMMTRGAPFVSRGLEVRRPVFLPRAAAGYSFGTGGPDGLGFPDAYLSLMVHYYLDAIYLFQAGAYLDVTGVVGSSLDPVLSGDPEKRRQIARLISRASRQGLGVYWCVTLPGFLPPEVYSRHPGIRGGCPEPYVICLSTEEGRSFIEDAARRIVEQFPGLRGIVVLRTEMSHTCGGRQRCGRCRRETDPDHDPVQRIFEWTAAAARSINPDVETIAFDWRGGGILAPDEPGLPDGIDYWMRPDRFVSGTPENDIRDVEPHDAFTTLVRSHRPGRRVWVESQLSHPFPFHTQPEIPVADLYWRKWLRLRELTDSQPIDSPPLAFAGGNGSGFAPTTMQDLGLRVLLWDPIGPMEDELRRVARRWFGPDATEDVLAAWHTFSQAVREHVHFGKYFTRACRTRLPGFEDKQLTAEQLASTALLRNEWSYGVARLRRAAEKSSPGRSELARLSVAMAEGGLTAFESARNALRWADAFGRIDPLTARDRLPPSATAGARAILEAERLNTERTIALFSRYAQFRTHPYYRNWFALPTLVFKERQLARAVEQLRP